MLRPTALINTTCQGHGPLLIGGDPVESKLGGALTARTPISTTCRWERKRKRHRQRLTLRPGLAFGQSSSPDNPSGEEPPETLFMKELRRRGISQSTDTNKSTAAEANAVVEDANKGLGVQSNPNEPATLLDERNKVDQRMQSMSLNSEGLEGLFPRAQALLSLGSSVFLAFWPLILSSVTIFAALYVYYGPVFIHSGGRMQGQNPYVDPYELLDKEQLPSEIGPSFVPFDVR